MSRRLTSGDHSGAMASQRRAFDFTLLFSVPFVAAFLTVPDVIMRAMFARGAFSKADAAAAGATLAAYAVGLIPFVLIRSAVATFYARKGHRHAGEGGADRVAVNVALKIALVGALRRSVLRSRQPLAPGSILLLVIGICGAGRVSGSRSGADAFAGEVRGLRCRTPLPRSGLPPDSRRCISRN